jgi:replicative DNA helicase
MTVAFADEVAEVESPTSALHNLETEQVLLGAIISQREAVSKVERIITAEDFENLVHQDLYAKILSIRDDGGELSYRIVKAQLGAFGAHDLGGLTVDAYAARLWAAAATPNEVVPLARAVRDMAQRRELAFIGMKMKEMAEDDEPITDTVAGAMAALDAIAASRSDEHTRPVSLGDAALSSIERMQDAINNPGHIGLTSGLHSIDDKTGGFQRGELIVVAGRPGMGKSALATAIAKSQAETGHNVLMFSLEMSKQDIADRAIADTVWSVHSPIKYQDIRLGKVVPERRQELTDAARAFRELPLEIELQGGLTISQIAARARKKKQNLERQGKTLDVVVVDHLHLIKPSNRYQGNPTQEVTEISNGLKALAKELNVAVIAMAQLNRGVENRDNKRPGMADLRQSGTIEQDADLILLLFWEPYYLKQPGATPEAEMARLSRLAVVSNRFEIDIAKQRNGPTGIVELYCDMGSNAFRDLAEGAR